MIMQKIVLGLYLMDDNKGFFWRSNCKERWRMDKGREHWRGVSYKLSDNQVKKVKIFIW